MTGDNWGPGWCGWNGVNCCRDWLVESLRSEGDVKKETLVMMMTKIGMKQMRRQYFDAVNWEMAQQIKGKTGITKGRCLELNANNGCLGLALAEQTLLEIYSLVNSDLTERQIARQVSENCLESRMRVLKGSSQKIPLPDGGIELIVSKSSVFLWQNRATIFREIYRVLAPGGVACLCGDYETPDLQQRIDAKLEACCPLVKRQLRGSSWRHRMLELDAILREAEINNYEMNYSDNGLWILVRKPLTFDGGNNAVKNYNPAINCPVFERS
jgi:SAM-dependent methyltransferase